METQEAGEKINEHEIELLGEKVFYQRAYSSRTRRIRLVIYPGGDIKVTTPHKVQESFVHAFMESKAKWILAKLEKQKQLTRPSKTGSRAEYLTNKASALTLAKTRLEHFNRHYGFAYNNVRIKNNTSLWGSCSRKGNLNFSYKIVLLPSELCDYIIVHELCHLKEFNHSHRFWNLVAQTIPNHKNLRRKIKGLQ